MHAHLQQAFELRGAGRVDEASVCTVGNLLWAITGHDLGSSEAAPIVRRLREIPSTLKFVLDHKLTWVGCMGLDTASNVAVSFLCLSFSRNGKYWNLNVVLYCCTAQMLCTLVFGKDESSDVFSFTQVQIDSVLVQLQAVLTGMMAAWVPSLPPYWFRPLVHL